MVLLILAKIGVVAGCALVGLALVGAIAEDLQNNHPRKPLMAGCHGTLVEVPYRSLPDRGETYLCWNTTRLP